MNSVGYSLIGFLIAIAILVAVHEFGHFWVARKLGVKVLKFSIGFGKSIYSWRRKNDPTEYSIALIPLGGFIKMLDEREADVDDSEKHLAFNTQSLPVRSAIVAAGPLFNFLFAILAIWLVMVVGSQDIRPIIGDVAESSIASDAGFEPGDRLVSVDGKPIQTWGEHQFYLMLQAMKGERVSFELEGVDQISRTSEIDFSEVDQQLIGKQAISSILGFYPNPPAAVVSKIVADSPAQNAGLKSGDEILEIDGMAIGNWFEMVNEVYTRPGEDMILRVMRDGELLDVPLTTKTVVSDDTEYGQIGLFRPETETVKLSYGAFAAIKASLIYNWQMTEITFRSLGRMLTNKLSPENLSGPITIARIAGETVKTGFSDFMKFLAIISISLGILNLLPIPVLDGGHLLYFLVEAVKGSPPSEKMMLFGQYIGLALLAMLMSLAFYNDIMRLFN